MTDQPVAEDPRRRIPRTDALLALPEVRAARARLSDAVLAGLVRRAQDRARSGRIDPDDVAGTLVADVAARSATSLRPVLNATGVVVHTNLGRAPLSPAAVEALVTASGYVDVEMDLASGVRSRRGAGTREALLAAVPGAEDALVVNNGAAALVLATTALAAGREVVVSRGEFVEIGAGFRLPDLIASTGARLREVGTTNRTHRADYADAIGPDTGCLLKVHPSNFRVEGFTAAVPVAGLHDLATEHGVPLVVDVGSGLTRHDPALPTEPDLAAALADGADVVIASGDKLLGGPQAGLLLGRAETIQRLARHPLARAVRADKLTLAALEATLAGGPTPVVRSLHADPERLRERAEALATALRSGDHPAGDRPAGDRPADATPDAGPGGTAPGPHAATTGVEVVPHDGRVGGGGAPGVPLPGWAVRLPAGLAPLLRSGEPVVVPRVHDGACLVDLRCVPEDDDDRLAAAVRAALEALAGGAGA